MTAVIETNKLTKVYESGMFSRQDVRALTDIDLSIEKGEIFAYLGPNGSGKTTTIKLLLGLIFPTSGTMQILGSRDIGAAEIRRQIGFLPEGAYYPDFLKGEEVLKFYGNLYGLTGRDLKKRIDTVLDTVGMTHARKRLIRGYSKGMRQRIGLAQALLSDPAILILDEPTTGLDPLARKDIRDILAALRDRGKTLLISSHELLEVELISDRVGILYQGELKTCGSLGDLLSDRDTTIEIEAPSPEALEKLEAAQIATEERIQDHVLLRVPKRMSLYEALEICKQQNVNVVSVAPKRETLEELFVRVIGAAEEEVRAAAGA